jgi:hypothetical protein
MMLDHNGNMIVTGDDTHMLIQQISTDKNSVNDHMNYVEDTNKNIMSSSFSIKPSKNKQRNVIEN